MVTRAEFCFARAPMKILAVHGLGHQERNPQSWQPGWTQALREVITRWRATEVEVAFAEYDGIFGDAPMQVGGTLSGFGRLLWDEVRFSITDTVSNLWPFRRRGFGDNANELLKWKIGMVTQFAEDETLRANLRASLTAQIEAHQPDVIFAHSLGTLLTYDLFLNPPDNAIVAGRYYVTAGCQIGRAALRTLFGGRLNGVAARQWYNLYNRHDDVLVVPLVIHTPNYGQVSTDFDIAGLADHDAVEYIRHANAQNKVWREIAGLDVARVLSIGAGAAKKVKQDRGEALFTASVTEHHPKRALLVGINDYPNPDDRLEGCVNDVFRMSATLQQIGFKPEDIRIVLNERATAAAIRERFKWLLEEPRTGDTRVFFYSGHGAQIPDYGSDETVDHQDETLVPFDFDWNDRATHLTDDEFSALYAQLPYDMLFAAFFDCCHSGGIARSGGAKIRGMNPPDDIRHRMLKWNWDEETWEPRNLDVQDEQPAHLANDAAMTGAAGTTNRLFRGVALRQMEKKTYNRRRKEFDHRGPYLPLIFEACGEAQYAYEYRDGVTSYGAYTYFLTQELFRAGHAGEKLTFAGLAEAVRERIGRHYNQTPQLLGPDVMLEMKVPWHVPETRTKPRKPAAK